MKLSINLLPSDVILLEKNQARQTTLNQLSIAVIACIVFFTGIIFILKLSQQQQLSGANQELTSAQDQATSLKNEAGIIQTLKKRLETIASFDGLESKGLTWIAIVNGIKPVTIKTNHLAINREGKLAYSGESTGSADLKVFFDNLTDPKLTEDRVNSINIETLSRSSNDQYKFDLNMDLK